MYDSESAASQHSFEIEEIKHVGERMKKEVQLGLSTVWNAYVGEPRKFKVIFASNFFHPRTREPLDWSSEYDPDSETFTFAVDTARERVMVGLPEEETMFLLAAHEAYHAVQVHQGNRPPSSLENQGYSMKDPHEEEAWLAAVKAFKKVHPGAVGKIITGGIEVDV